MPLPLPTREGCRPQGRRGRRPLAVLALALFCLAPVSADRTTARAQFQAGNEAYKAGDFAHARDAYLQAWAAGGTGPNLCHNLANAYYKLQDAPRALLWYRRALRLAPRDRDINTNLNRLLLALPETIPDVPPTSLHAAARWMVVRLSLGELSAIAALWLWALVGVIVYHLRIRRLHGRLQLLPWGLAALLLLFVILTGVRWERDYGARHAIVLAPAVTLVSGPGSSFDRVLDARGGLTVTVITTSEGWVQVRVPTGVTGWLQKGDVEEI